MYNDPLVIIIIFLAVLCGGLVKGTIGFGMPMVALPIIAFLLPATKAIIILCAPIFITNFIQMKIKEGITSYRFFPMLLSLVLGLLIGARLILEIELNTVTQLIAISVIFVAIINRLGLEIKSINKNWERSITIIIGFSSGILGGLSSFYGPPMLAYLVALKLKKETFVRVVSTMYFIGSFPLYGSLMYYGLGTINDLYFSLFLIIPALIGQQVGSRIRHKISENMFRIFVLIILFILGFALLLTTL